MIKSINTILPLYHVDITLNDDSALLVKVAVDFKNKEIVLAEVLGNSLNAEDYDVLREEIKNKVFDENDKLEKYLSKMQTETLDRVSSISKYKDFDNVYKQH